MLTFNYIYQKKLRILRDKTIEIHDAAIFIPTW